MDYAGERPCHPSTSRWGARVRLLERRGVARGAVLSCLYLLAHTRCSAPSLTVLCLLHRTLMSRRQGCHGGV